MTYMEWMTLRKVYQLYLLLLTVCRFQVGIVDQAVPERYIYFTRSKTSSWRPSELTTTQDVKVEVVHGLTSLCTVVNHDSVSIRQAQLLGCSFGSNHQMTQ